MEGSHCSSVVGPRPKPGWIIFSPGLKRIGLFFAVFNVSSYFIAIFVNSFALNLYFNLKFELRFTFFITPV